LFPDASPAGMTKSHALWLIANGTPITTVSGRLGCAKLNITLDSYAHVVAAIRREALPSRCRPTYSGRDRSRRRGSETDRGGIVAADRVRTVYRSPETGNAGPLVRRSARLSGIFWERETGLEPATFCLEVLSCSLSPNLVYPRLIPTTRL